MSYNNKSFVSLVKEIDAEYRIQRDRGTLFELLVVSYLKNEPMYNRLFDGVWTLSEVPEKYNIPRVDTGVDLVARKRDTEELVAVQCKYYSKDTTIRKIHIDSFLNEVGKNYYSEGMIVTTTDKWADNADHRVPISDEIADELVKKDSNSDNNPKNYLFVRLKGQRKGKPIPTGTVNNNLNRLAVAAKIKDDNGCEIELKSLIKKIRIEETLQKNLSEFYKQI